MVQVYLGTPADQRFRDGCDFVPLIEDEIQEIMEMDQSEGRTWSPPPTISSNFNGLVKEFEGATNTGYQVVSNEVHRPDDDQPEEAG